MTFVAPAWIALAAGASLVVAAIHLIAWRMPRTVVLPTARFVPDEPARRAARTLRPSDLALLALRIAVLMLGGLAMAQPRFSTPPAGQATVVAVERSGAVANVDTVREVLGGAVSPGDDASYVVFDTVAQTLHDAQAALTAAAAPDAPNEASLTVGLVAAIREARRLQDEYETVRVVVASTFTNGAFDAATATVRRTWGDSVRLIRLAAAVASARPPEVESDASVDDPVIAGVRLAESNGLLRGTSRIIRDSVAAGAMVDSGATLVLWPRANAVSPTRVDGVQAGGYTALGHFAQVAAQDSGRVIARWVSGDPAAWEVRRDGQCVRRVGFDVPDGGDFTLSPSFQRLVGELLRPCIEEPSAVASDSVIAALASFTGDGRETSLPDEDVGPSRFAALLLVLAIALLLVEFWFRRRATAIPVELRA